MTIVDSTTGEVVEVRAIPIDLIDDGPAVRAQRVSLDHVFRLQEVVDELPPIVVRPKGERRFELIDGRHRLGAHRNVKRPTITAHVVEMDDQSAYRAAVRANTTHGLVLTLSERLSAAKRLLRDCPDLSDRVIAADCGLSHVTVAETRAKRSGGQSDHLNTPEKRIGSDGKKYPLPDAAKAARAEAEAIVEAEPDISTRDLSERTGVSVGTAANVKKGGHLRDVSAPEPDAPPTVAEIVTVIPSPWKNEDACNRSDAGRDFALFMDRRTVRDDEVTADGCPAELLDGAIAAAEVNAAAWTRLANALRTRGQRMEVVK